MLQIPQKDAFLELDRTWRQFGMIRRLLNHCFFGSNNRETESCNLILISLHGMRSNILCETEHRPTELAVRNSVLNFENSQLDHAHESYLHAGLVGKLMSLCRQTLQTFLDLFGLCFNIQGCSIVN